MDGIGPPQRILSRHPLFASLFSRELTSPQSLRTNPFYWPVITSRIDWRIFWISFVIFFAVYNREIAWYPPANFDQASYLMSTYRLQEDVLAHGFGKFWKAILSAPNATGVALPIEGALFGIIIGGARLPQLCVNFILF